MTAKSTATTIKPPTPPTTPPMMAFVELERPPPEELLLSANDVGCTATVVLISTALEYVLPLSVTRVTCVTTETIWEGADVVGGGGGVVEVVGGVGVGEVDSILGVGVEICTEL